MPNGRPGDHPVNDIVMHGMRVYSPEVDAIIKRLVQLGFQIQVENIALPIVVPPTDAQLQAMLAQLKAIQTSDQA